MIYEIINPSDRVTIEADNVLVAKAATLLIGIGQYGLRDEDGETLLPANLFGVSEEYLQSEGFDDFVAFVRDNRSAVASCLKSAMYCGIRERAAVLARIGDDPDELNRFNEAERSSMNNIAGRAGRLAAGLLERIP